MISVLTLMAAFCLPWSALAQDGDSDKGTVTFVARSADSASTDDSANASSNKDSAKADDAKDKDKDAKDKDDDDDDKCWSVGADLGIDLGIGAFVKNEYARKVRSRLTFSVNGSYTIPVIDVDIHAETGFSAWLSTGGGTNGKHEFRWADSEIGLSREIWSYKKDSFRIGFNADLSFTLPTSTASIHENLYTTISPTLSMSIKWHKLRFGYSISYAHSFHEYTSATVDPTEVDALSRSTGVELLGTHDIAQDGVLTEIELVNKFSIGIQFIKQLRLGVGFGFSDAWTYDNGTITENDDLVSQFARVGRGHSQASLGTVSLLYAPLDMLSISLTMASMQPWKTRDNKTIRFPWFDTISPARNYTKFILGVSFNY